MTNLRYSPVYMAIRTKKPTIASLDDVLTFGQYAGKTVREVMEDDPGYVVWMGTTFDMPTAIVDEAYRIIHPEQRQWFEWGDVDKEYPKEEHNVQSNRIPPRRRSNQSGAMAKRKTGK